MSENNGFAKNALFISISGKRKMAWRYLAINGFKIEKPEKRGFLGSKWPFWPKSRFSKIVRESNRILDDLAILAILGFQFSFLRARVSI